MTAFSYQALDMEPSLEAHVASHALSKELKELGLPNDGLFYYALFNGIYTPTYRNDLRRGSSEPLYSFTRAPTAIELGHYLPPSIDTLKGTFFLTLHSHGFGEWAAYYTEDTVFRGTEANTRGNLLAWLVKNGYVKL